MESQISALSPKFLSIHVRIYIPLYKRQADAGATQSISTDIYALAPADSLTVPIYAPFPICELFMHQFQFPCW